MSERILLAVDGGSASRSAIRWTTHHVGARPVTIDLVSVLDTAHHHDDELRSRMRDVADEMLIRSAITLQTMLPTAKVTTALREGDPTDELVRLAHSATMLVVGTGRNASSKGSIMGSLPSRIAARASCVTIVVPSNWVARSGPVVVGSAADRAADAALRFATAQADRESADLVIGHAWQLPGIGYADLPGEAPDVTGSISVWQHRVLDAEVATVRGRTPGMTVSADLREGPAAPQLLAMAANASLLVVGRRTRPGIARVLLGSVSHDVLTAPPCPVAVVPQPTRPIDVPRETAAEYI